MTTSTRQRTKRVATQASEIALAVPQVVAHRMARMATSGANPTARDRREFQRMGAEKIAAFGESWNATAWPMSPNARATMPASTGYVKNTYHLRLVCAIQNLERAQALSQPQNEELHDAQRLAA